MTIDNKSHYKRTFTTDSYKNRAPTLSMFTCVKRDIFSLWTGPWLTGVDTFVRGPGQRFRINGARGWGIN